MVTPVGAAVPHCQAPSVPPRSLLSHFSVPPQSLPGPSHAGAPFPPLPLSAVATESDASSP